MLSAAGACGTLGPDLDQVVAIEVSVDSVVEELDTLRPHARALDGRGDSVATPIYWAALDTNLMVLDSATGLTLGRRPGTGRLQARAGPLPSNPIAIRVLAAADTLVAPVPTHTVDTVTISATTPPDSLSDSLKVELADTVSTPPSTVPLAGRPITYAIIYPATPGPVTLVTSDTAHALVTVDTVITSSAGTAAVRARLLAPLPSDSVVITASARRAVGTTVPGSPVTFVVRFLP
ncbi:MAG TPA: hypothetical protein VIW28_09330 [Gemmatimonadales bacterium]